MQSYQIYLIALLYNDFNKGLFMNILEAKMLDILVDLHENHNVESIKAEFEAEGTRLEEALRLKEIVTKAGLDLTIKIGGCEAIKDMYDARAIGANTIVAPMIESSYALKKYVQALNFVFPQEERKQIKFLINIETISGFKNLDDIINSSEFYEINGITLGRSDMAGSMGLSKDKVDSDEIFNMAEIISLNMKNLNKDMVIGGNVSALSLEFFKKIPYLSRFETRKVIFNREILNKNPLKSLSKALEFELMWQKNKLEFHEMMLNKDKIRLKLLEERYEKLTSFIL